MTDEEFEALLERMLKENDAVLRALAGIHEPSTFEQALERSGKLPPTTGEFPRKETVMSKDEVERKYQRSLGFVKDMPELAAIDNFNNRDIIREQRKLLKALGPYLAELPDFLQARYEAAIFEEDDE